MSGSKFNFVKARIADALLNKPVNEVEQAEYALLRVLLNTAIDRGSITESDVQSAMESIVTLDLDQETADELIVRINRTSDKLIGKFTKKQVAQLRKLRDLCYRAMEGKVPFRALTIQLTDLIYNDPR
jgi:hypothetical protein